jgi:flagellar biosynthesis chaperone FliJ
MEIIIPLPNFSANTYQGLKSYLKQLETAIHYAQKSVENAEKEGIQVTEDVFVEYQHAGLDNKIIDENYEELQNIGLHINLQ